MTTSIRAERFKVNAFTLVELLVVIGIIAVLIGILLPVLGNATTRARTVACQANLRSINQALVMYTGENKGSYPWGWQWTQGNPTTGNGITPGDYFDWCSVVSHYWNKNRPDGYISGTGGGSTPYKSIGQALKCPEVLTQGSFRHGSDYTAHPVIIPDFYQEMKGYVFGEGPGLAGTGRQVAPAKLNRVYPDNALVWDSPAWGLTNFPSEESIVNIWSYTAIDLGALLYPQSTLSRYRGKIEDLTAGDPFYGWEKMILMPNNKTQPWNANQDIVTTYSNGQLGGLRFRHNKNTGVNVLFADGSVRTIGWKPNRPGDAGPNYYNVDFKRKFLLIKWPPGVDPTF